jgi:hypothetical protein
VPAIAAAIAWAAPHGRRIRHLAGGGAALLVSGGAWPLLVALTPAADRPWISGTSDNSIWSLITSYNGLGRLDGQSGRPRALGANGFFGGATGPFRLLNDALGPQAGWLLGFALVAGVAILLACRLRRRDLRTGWLIAVGGGWLTIAVAFSAARGIFHPYYVAQLAPFTAALVGGGVGELAGRDLRARVLAPVAVGVAVVTEVVLLSNNSEVLSWLPIPLVVLGAIAAFALSQPLAARARVAALVAAMTLLLVAPATWAADTLGHATQGTFPAGGPASAAMAGGGGFGGDSASLSTILRYTESHGGGTVAVSSQSGAASSIIQSGATVAGIGGFSGRESQVSVAWLSEQVRSGRLRWIVIGGSGGGPPGMQSQSTVLQAFVKQHGTAVTSVGTTGGMLYRLSIS